MKKVTAGRDALGDFAPKFAELNDDVLFGEVWSREDKLPARDRSIVTVTALMASGVLDSSLAFHIGEAKKNGITKEEMAEVLGVCVRTIERHLSVEGTENVERENTKEENECRKTEQDRCVLQFPDKYTTEYDIENLEEKSDRPDKNAPIYFFTIGTGG